MLKNKKGILGLETVRIVIVTLLILGVTAIAVFLALTSLQDSNIFQNSSASGQFGNETILLSSTGAAPNSVNGLGNVVLTTVLVVNATGGEIVVEEGNFTIAGGVFTNLTDSPYNLNNINVTANFTHEVTSSAVNATDAIIGNVTSGTSDFFANVPTFMVLLGVVVLLLIIAIVLIVVGRFGGSSAFGGTKESLQDGSQL